MPSLERGYRHALVVAFLVSIMLHLNARSEASAGSAQNPGDQEARIQRIEATAVEVPMREAEPPLRLDLQKLMQLYKVPGLSIAVIDNFHIIWAKAYGVIEAGSTRPVTPRTLFQAGSISKPVAASGALYLVEHGKLSLDEDVNQKLTTWKVPDNEFTEN
jgi:CubicO group peptidase (beta-lactamase class C family)